MFATLRSNGELQNTLAFYVSDNGLLWGDHGLGGKGAPYTQSVQIPMYMRWTGHVTKRATKRRIVANIDVAPTIVEAAGLGGTAPMDGRPLLSSAARSRILLEMFGSNSRPDVRWAATVSRDRQYVEYFAGDSSTPTFREYYATASDPWQLRNLLGDPLTSNDPDVGSLSDQLDRDRRCAGADCP